MKKPIVGNLYYYFRMRAFIVTSSGDHGRMGIQHALATALLGVGNVITPNSDYDEMEGQAAWVWPEHREEEG